MKLIPKPIGILILTLLISACTDESRNETSEAEPGNPTNKMTISGSVGDGPIVGATINVKSDGGRFLATTTSDDQANYLLEVETREEDFPLILKAYNGLDLVTGTTPDFTLASVILDDGSHQANLNPHSTLIVETAQRMPGGLTTVNLQQATHTVLTSLNFGLDLALVSNPVTSAIDEHNVVTITHASEALAEMLRRTKRFINDPTVDEDGILVSLAADLTDGNLDGIGADRTMPRITAVSHVVGLQVLLETMLHDLHVNDVAADDALTSAINIIMGTRDQTFSADGSTQISPLMLNQATAALAALQVIDASQIIVSLGKALNDLGETATTEDLTSALANHGLDLSIASSLHQGIQATVTATDTQILAINEAANSAAGIAHDEDSETDSSLENRAPLISGDPAINVAEGESYAFTPKASDSDGDVLSFSIDNRPVWASFDPATGTLSGIPSFDQSSSYDNIEIFVTDGTASTPLDAFDILVSNTNRAPHIDGVPYTSVTEGFSYAFTPTASDPDGDPLTFTIQNQPAWADFNTSSGSLTGTPTLEDAGAYDNIIINVSDGLVTTALNSFSIRVKDANQPPMITGTPTTQVAEDHNYAFMPIASDPDGDRLLFKISNQPPWSYFDTTTGILSGTPGFDDAGDYNDIQISVSDGMIEVSLNAFSILVSETNQAPLIEGIPSSSTAEGEAYDFKPSANDPDGDTLRFTILNKPAWAAFSTSTGSLSGIPDFSDAGSYESIRISVSDGHSTTSLETFSITVNNTNQPPTISGNPSSDVAENDTYYFIPDASDPDGENLTFEIENRPSWASFDQSSGSLSGTPDFASAGDYNNIKISVFDGSDRVYLAPFGITVTDTNRPPVISGTPASSVVIGDSYSFIPNATDPDDDSLSFNITNLPSWASFDRASGAITGSPEVDDFGLYEDITLSVSDSLNEASLSLTIMVEEPSVTTGSAKLTWNIPTTRTDGTALDSSDIGGYRIYMGMDELKLDEQNMVMVKDTEDGLVTEYEAMNLPSGTYFFKVKAYDKAGNESQLSNYAMKEI